ncbi:MAG: AAA family ATPase [Colwellia sp.]
MGKLLEVNNNTLDSQAKISAQNSIILGLPKGDIGFVLAAPGTGKGYLCLSLCYELASDLKLLGLKVTETPQRCLYWPIEDGVPVVAKRIKKHMNSFSKSTQALIQQNFMLWDSNQYISSDINDNDGHTELNQLIEAAREFDVLIIDTIRESVGPKDEVKDDKEIKFLLQKIAKAAGVAIIVSHHLTKDAVKGKENITSVSGSGLSETLANSRMQLYLECKKKGRASEELTYVSHIKHNYIEKDRAFNSLACEWTDSDLLRLNSLPVHNNKKTLIREHIVEEEPTEIDMTKVALSESSFLLMEEQRESDSLLSKDDLELHKQFIDSKKDQ